MMFLVFAVFVAVAPIVAIVISSRDHQLMAPAIGAFETATVARGERLAPSATTSWQSLAPLVRLEALRLVRHPAPYAVAFPFLAMFFASEQYTSADPLSQRDVEAAIFLVPYAWGTLIASNLLTLRSRRWHSDELLATTAVPHRSRTLAHLMATTIMLPGAVVLLVAWFLLGRTVGQDVGTPRLEVLAVGLLLVVGAGCVGVAVARWLPRPAFGWLAVLATIILQVNAGHEDPVWRWLHFSIHGTEWIGYPGYSLAHHPAHLVYLAGGIALVAAVALARDGVDRSVMALAVVGLAAVVVTGAIQVQPLTDVQADELAALVEDPGRGQVCEPHPRYRLCHDPAYAPHTSWWGAPVEGVLARVPADARPEAIVVRQRPMIDARSELPGAVASRVDPSVAWPDDDEVSVSGQWRLPSAQHGDTAAQMQLGLAFRVASAVLGLPADAWWTQPTRGSDGWTTIPLAARLDESEDSKAIPSPLVQCSAAGEARGVAAAWLAAQSTPDARQALRRLAGTAIGYGLVDAPMSFDTTGSYKPGMPSTLPEQGTLLRGADIIAAAALLDRDDAAVAATLQQHWPELTGDAVLSSEALLGWFGIDQSAASAGAQATTPAPPPEPDSEDVPPTPIVAGPCPAGRPR